MNLSVSSESQTQRVSKKYTPVFYFHLMMCDIGVIFKMMFFSFVLLSIGNILVEGKRHTLECWSTNFLCKV